MIDWTDAAIEAAEDVINKDFPYSPETETVRAALDAAVKAQGKGFFAEVAFADGYTEGHADGRNEALEEAAKKLRAYLLNESQEIADNADCIICELKEKK